MGQSRHAFALRLYWNMSKTRWVKALFPKIRSNDSLDVNLTNPDEMFFVSLPPPPNTENTIVLSLVAVYSALFLVGLYGNTAVLTYVMFLTRSLKQSVLSLGNTFIYVVALCVVDSLVILTLPMTIMDLVLGQWMFGTAFCKVYFVFESLNKFMSTFVLTALAFDRFMGVCYPTKTKLHGVRATFYILFASATVALGSLVPVIYRADAHKRPRATTVQLEDNIQGQVEIIKCVDNLNVNMRVAFSGYTFVLGFLIPATLITFFYGKLLWRVIRQYRAMSHSSIPVKRVTFYTMAVTLFYFICWTPYWAISLHGLFYTIIKSRKHPMLTSNTWVYFMYAVHAMPYVNSAFNWIFYAQLNTQFRKGLWLVAEQMKRRGSRAVSYYNSEAQHHGNNNQAYQPLNLPKNGSVTNRSQLCTLSPTTSPKARSGVNYRSSELHGRSPTTSPREQSKNAMMMIPVEMLEKQKRGEVFL